MSGPLFRLPRAERLAEARKWEGATVDVVLGRDTDPATWTRYPGVTVLAAAVPTVGTFADVVVIRRTDGRVWRFGESLGRQSDPVDTDTLAVSLADVRSIRPAFV